MFTLYLVPPHNWWKDVILALVLVSCVMFAGLAVRERKNSQGKIDHLMDLMKTAENELIELQQSMLVTLLTYYIYHNEYSILITIYRIFPVQK